MTRLLSWLLPRYRPARACDAIPVPSRGFAGKPAVDHVQAEAVVAMMGWQPFTEIERNTIRAGRAEGIPYDVIADSMDRSSASIRAQAQKLGITGKRGGRRKHNKPKGTTGPQRKCLYHGGLFQASHRLEFICDECKNSDEYVSAARLP